MGNLLDSESTEETYPVRWPLERQKDLFEHIKRRNNIVYEELLSHSKSMNNHSLDIINIAISSTWQEILDSRHTYPMDAILSEQCLCALFLNDPVFKNWEMKNRTGLLDELNSKYTIV